MESAPVAPKGRECSNVGRCRTPQLPERWAWKLCRECQIKKYAGEWACMSPVINRGRNETNKRNRLRQKAQALQGETATPAAPEPATGKPPSGKRKRRTKADREYDAIMAAIEPSSHPPGFHPELSPEELRRLYPISPTGIHQPVASPQTLGSPYQFLTPPPHLAMAKLAYPIPNKELIATLNLQPHVEGGYFAETDRSDQIMANPYGNGEPRAYHTTIYYLLTPDSRHSFFHRHAADSIHILQQGRARFTYIQPTPLEPTPFQIKQFYLGPDMGAGESMQFRIPGGWWRFVELLDADIDAAPDPDRVGMLMTEVCVPGFAFNDHACMTMRELEEICKSPSFAPSLANLRKYIKPS